MFIKLFNGLKSADPVDKLRNFLDGEFIFDATNLKFQHAGRYQYPTISSAKATGELT